MDVRRWQSHRGTELEEWTDRNKALSHYTRLRENRPSFWPSTL